MYKRIKAENYNFHYLEFGKNRQKTVLCLHGYADSAVMFSNLGKLLEPKYHLLALDFPMSYESEKIQSIKSLSNYVSRFVKTLGLRQFVLVGFSLGGLVAIDYTHCQTHKVEKLYLLSSSPQLLTAKFELTLCGKFKPILTSKPFCLIYSLLNRNKYIRALFKAPPLPENTIRRMKEFSFSIFGTLFNILDVYLVKKFNSLTVPKTIIFFKDDEILRWKRYKKLIMSLDCHLAISDKGGHASKEDYWEDIQSFLNDPRSWVK